MAVLEFAGQPSIHQIAWPRSACPQTQRFHLVGVWACLAGVRARVETSGYATKRAIAVYSKACCELQRMERLPASGGRDNVPRAFAILLEDGCGTEQLTAG